jgi:hypothetical protein
MSLPPAALFAFDFFGPLPIPTEVSGAPLTSDAGLLPLRQFDKRIDLTKEFAAVLDDPRDPDLVEHSFTDMVRMRIFGIVAGYGDQNDHDTLRTDAVFQLIAGPSPADVDPASQPTLARFENAITIKSLKRLREAFIDQFIASFDTPPRHLTFDLDVVDDPAHGHQQLTFWHGYYDHTKQSRHPCSCAASSRDRAPDSITVRPGAARRLGSAIPFGDSRRWTMRRDEDGAPPIWAISGSCGKTCGRRSARRHGSGHCRRSVSWSLVSAGSACRQLHSGS